MFALEGNAGTVKKLQAHPDPKADEPRSASRTTPNGYRATKQNLHDLVVENAGPKNKAADDSLSSLVTGRTTSDGLPALAQRQVTTHPPRGASPPSPAGGMSADLTGSSMKMDIGPTFSRRSLALGFVVVLAFPVAPVFAGREHRAGEDAAKKFLGSIYQRYLGKSSAAATGVPLTDAQSVRSNFTFALASLILEDRAAATKQGESPVLGTDPFIGRPEWDVSDLSVDVKD